MESDMDRVRRIHDAWPRIVVVEPLDGFRLKCRYSDGLEGVADLSDEAELRWRSNPESFAKVAIEGRELVWANGMDACGDFIRMRIQGTAWRITPPVRP